MFSYSDKSSGFGEIFISAMKGFAISVVAAAVLLFAAAGIAINTTDPNSLTSPLGYTALYISAATAGAVSSKLSGYTGGTAVLSAAVSGVMMLVILLLMSFLPAETTVRPISPPVKMLMYAAVPAVSALSGLLFRRKQKRGRHPVGKKLRKKH